ncbi:MAG: hypothetical protein U0694_10385 [Anaerolineae bacterium]
MNDTLHARPAPKRLPYGLQAWQATIGYIHNAYSPDAALAFRAYPFDGGVIGWAATASWATESVSVRDLPSLDVAMSELWREFESRYDLLKSFEAHARRPAGYADDEWLDPPTQSILDRLMQVTWFVFKADWAFAAYYQPIEQPETRVQTLLMAKGGAVRIKGRGATLEDACRELFLSAAKEYKAFGKG